ncbi:GntR family transcriptional regulator [Nonomuraea sp. NPDC050790]|uniref:GntR family transcriptional regulator n=1 Tax=Nonomuraea sp. NPDC050790 TaxID=3364371 RepID=UPI00379DEDBB
MARTPHDSFHDLALPPSLDPDRSKGEQIREILELMARALPPGTLLPSERSVAERYQVARGTVRQQVQELVMLGVISRSSGSGTYVAEPKLQQGTTMASFSEEMRARGRTPAARILSARVRRAGAALAERLGVDPGERVVDLRRLRSADGTPIAIEHTHLSARRFPGLPRVLRDDMSLYATLAGRWNVHVERAVHRVSAVALGEREAALLGAAPALPSFLVERQAWDRGGAVVEWGRSTYRGDFYDLVFEVGT